MLKVSKRFISFEDSNYRKFRSIYGVGSGTAISVSKSLGFSKEFVLSKLKEYHYTIRSIRSLFAVIECFLETSLREANQTSLSVLAKLRAYRGIRYFRGFPIRGQRRHTNASTSHFLVTKIQKARRNRKKRR